jgi:protein-L-isoaspartate(D-aspartate) O-methyltransferase
MEIQTMEWRLRQHPRCRSGVCLSKCLDRPGCRTRHQQRRARLACCLACSCAAVQPKDGDQVVHIGAGLGYYSAILATLVAPGGSVAVFELDEKFADRARKNLQRYEIVTVTCGNAVTQTLPKADIVYVNAGVVAPPASWLHALAPGGRLIFPWQPTANISVAEIVTKTASDLSMRVLMPSFFIPCEGAVSTSADVELSHDKVWSARSIRITEEHPPDDTQIAVYDQVWISSRATT